MENNTSNNPLDNSHSKDTDKRNEKIDINPGFQSLLSADALRDSVLSLKSSKGIPHSDILREIIDSVDWVDFKELAYPKVIDMKMRLKNLSKDSDEFEQIVSSIDDLSVRTKHFIVYSIENLHLVARKYKFGLCKNNGNIFIYNGAYWGVVDKEAYHQFLGEAVAIMGVRKVDAKHYEFRDKLFRQFMSTSYLKAPEIDRNTVVVNLQNGTFQISTNGNKLRPFKQSDFLTYQLPFEYNEHSQSPIFQSYLDRVLPDKDCQKVLAEYVGYVFIKNGNETLKEEKALILYGSGANGKSVFFEIVNALLGEENICNYSLQSLTDQSGYFRAKISNKLVNYATEINGKLESSIFKQLVSGEPVEARLPYGEPFSIKQYAKLIFNCNELPREVEQTHAFFRRFLIIPFDVTIPDDEQDKHLHTKIIDKELSGVFNWVLSGLERLLKQKKFTSCEASHNALNLYKKQSDSVKMFISEREYVKSTTSTQLIKHLYDDYKSFCMEDGFKPVNKTNFKKRLEASKIEVKRINVGNVAYLSGGTYLH